MSVNTFIFIEIFSIVFYRFYFVMKKGMCVHLYNRKSLDEN